MSFTKVAPAGIGTEPGTSILIGDSLLHSTGIDIGSSTGVGVTIRQHGDATFTGIITASAFFGDGSGLEGVSSSGIGTALNDDDTNVLNKIYYVNQELSIGSTVTVNHPDTGTASYTHYQDLVVKNDADFIVADGDTFIPDILGITTSTLAASAATGGRIRAGTITNAGANGAVNFPNGLTGTAGTFTGAITAASGTITGNLGVAGVLTYEDVTNVDSVGVITARSGIRIGATGANQLISGNSNAIGFGEADPSPFGGEYRGIDVAYKGSGISGRTGNATFTMRSNIYYDGSNWKYGEGNTTAGVLSVGGAQLIFESAASGTAGATATITEKLRIGPVGQIGIGGANYGTSGQVLTSQGNSTIVQWATPSGGLNASYARITDTKGAATQGGSFSSGDWRTRDLQTEDEDPDGIVSISSNQFTLQAGTYYIKAQACAINVNNHTAKIRNITDSSDTLLGNSNKTQPSSNNVSAYALVQGSFTIAAAKTFELQHRCADTQTTHGFGAYNGFSTNVYATVEIYKRN